MASDEAVPHVAAGDCHREYSWRRFGADGAPRSDESSYLGISTEIDTLPTERWRTRFRGKLLLGAPSFFDRAGYVRSPGPFAVPVGPDDHLRVAVAVYVACRGHRVPEPAIERFALKDE